MAMIKYSKFSHPLVALALLFSAFGCAQQSTFRPQYHTISDAHDYTFAVYNRDNRLITDPYGSWKERSRLAQLEGKPYTDVFVIAHGWNFTNPEAVANYYRYIEVAEDRMGSKIQPKFRPYLIFVVWSSVTKPLSEAAASLLPYNIDKTIEVPTTVIDSLVFHIPSGWNESLEAYHNAVGTNLPSFYKNKSIGDQPFMNDQGFSINRKQGRDVPVSMILNSILTQLDDWKLKSKTDKKIPPRQRINLIGHSYGAKLVTLAAIESVRGYLNNFEDQVPPQPILESLILFNPAFHPSELAYPVDQTVLLKSLSNTKGIRGARKEEVIDALSGIHRKAVVFSNTDYATGFLYGVGQVLLNAMQTQQVDAFLEFALGDSGELSYLSPWIRRYLLQPVVAIPQVAWNVVTSSGEWLLRSLIQLPFEFAHHVSTNDTFGNNIASKILNVPHFFLPLDRLINSDVDKQGLWRTTLPALGRTGLYNQQLGHLRFSSPILSDLWALDYFAFDTNGQIRPGAMVDAHGFARMACSLDWSYGTEFERSDTIYTFDASVIYDTKAHPAGSHGDLRGFDEAEHCVGLGGLQGSSPEKRVTTVNFILNFLHGYRP